MHAHMMVAEIDIARETLSRLDVGMHVRGLWENEEDDSEEDDSEEEGSKGKGSKKKGSKKKEKVWFFGTITKITPKIINNERIIKAKWFYSDGTTENDTFHLHLSRFMRNVPGGWYQTASVE